MPTSSSRTALRHGISASSGLGSGGGSFRKLAKLGLMAVSNVPKLVRSHPTTAPVNGGGILVAEEVRGPNSPGFWVYFGIAFTLVVLGGLFAGLTLGLMGQDEIYLQVIQQSGDEVEKRNATKVLKLLKRGKHWVLVTLLLSNVITNETLPIVLDRSLGGGWPAVLSSTVLIVIFGEIIPQSVCVRYGLGVGAFLSPLVIFLMYLTYPVAYPTALLLDRILGEDHGTVYKKAGLKTLVTLHKSLGSHPSERLNEDEVTIISAVLDLKEKPVGAIMTPIKDVFTMSSETVLDEETMDEILSAGYSRIPIHAPDEPTNFIGMLLVKILITYDPEDGQKVGEFPLATLPETAEDTSCLDIVNFFQEGKSHMVLVSDFPGENHGALGVVTLEDVIEELIGEEIVDESDVFIDVHKAIRRLHPSPLSLGSSVRRSISAQYIARNADAQVVASAAAAIANTSDPDETTDLLITSGPMSPAVRTGPVSQIEQAMTRGRKYSGSRVGGLSDEVIAHLTLGPANLADRPRETTSKTVKIKQFDPSRRSEDISRTMHLGMYDGANGRFDGPSEGSASQTVLIKNSDGRAIPRGARMRPVPSAHRMKARTGSLIERTGVVDGVPKTVIETTSSSEDDYMEPGSTPKTNGGETSPLLWPRSR